MSRLVVFFLNAIRGIEAESEQARREWSEFVPSAKSSVARGQTAIDKIKTRSEEALNQRCHAFQQRLSDFDARAIEALHSVFDAWQRINVRTLRATIQHKGAFRNYRKEEFDLNQDLAKAYLDLVPFVWDEFFATHLAGLTQEVATEAHGELLKTGERIKGSMDMLRHQPDGVRDSIETSLHTAGESFRIQSAEIQGALSGQVQRTRQMLAGGMIEAAADCMQPAYAAAAGCPGGKGVKNRMLDILVRHAKQHAPGLFPHIRRELTEGVAVLQASIRPQHSKLLGYGAGVLDQFQRNMIAHQIATPEQRGRFQAAIEHMPPPMELS
jgi:hypothetical protein